MSSKFGLLCLVYSVLVSLIAGGEFQCPEKCKCAMVRSRSSSEPPGKKMVCSGKHSIAELGEFGLTETAGNFIQMIIRGTTVSQIKYGAFSRLPGLLKLDLSNNEILFIEDGSFLGLIVLEKLNLSNNKLSVLSPGIFEGLKSLSRLVLNDNFIETLSSDLFRFLPSMQVLDLANNRINCDCHLSWIVDFQVSHGVRISPKARCNLPLQVKGKSLARIEEKDMRCDWPFEIPSFEMTPKADQLVFVGDSLYIQCSISVLENKTTLSWLKNGGVVTSSKDGFISVETATEKNSQTILSSLVIKNIQIEHSGMWMCQVSSPFGNDTRSISIFVMKENTKNCPSVTTSDNKGTYVWPETFPGVTTELPCTGAVSGALSYNLAYAYYSCSLTSTWINLNTSLCPYVSDVTKILEQFAKTNLSLSMTSALDGARGLRNYTSDGSMLKDPIDVVFIARTVENYLEFVPRHKEIGDIIIDIVNTIMNVHPDILKAAQAEDQSCTRLIHAIEHLPFMDNIIYRHRDNIAVDKFVVKEEGFPGMTCTSYSGNSEELMKDNIWLATSFAGDKVLRCKMVNVTTAETTRLTFVLSL